MGVPSRVPRSEQIKIDRPVGSATDQLVEDVLRDLAWSLWGESTPAKIAAELKCHPRTIERYMEGARDWSGEAVAVVVEELLKRHRMRNVKVTKRS